VCSAARATRKWCRSVRPDEVEFPRPAGRLLHDPRSHHAEPPGQRCRHAVPLAIFYHSPEQKKDAEEAGGQGDKDKVWANPIVTEIVPASAFTKAEEEHQEYYERIGNTNPYCAFVVEPKVQVPQGLLRRLKR